MLWDRVHNIVMPAAMSSLQARHAGLVAGLVCWDEHQTASRRYWQKDSCGGMRKALYKRVARGLVRVADKVVCTRLGGLAAPSTLVGHSYKEFTQGSATLGRSFAFGWGLASPHRTTHARSDRGQVWTILRPRWDLATPVVSPPQLRARLRVVLRGWDDHPRDTSHLKGV